MKTVSFALAAAAILATVATAQNQLPVKKVTGPIKTLQYGVHTPKASPVIVYSNTILSGYYSVPGTNEEWIDHGIITGNGDHDTITGAQVGYATTLLTGPAIRVRTYDGYTGFCGSLTGLGFLDGAPAGLVAWMAPDATPIEASWVLAMCVIEIGYHAPRRSRNRGRSR